MSVNHGEAFVALLLIVLTLGCVVAKAPVRAYHFAYCQKMGTDGKCAWWATPCGKLECRQ